MKHFTTEDGIDFVSQVVPASRRLAMEKHLQDGCKRCAKTVLRWQRLRQWAAAEASYQPPQEAVRIVHAAFAGSEWAVQRKPASSLVEVLFDSFLQPAMEGVRSAGSGTRQMLYRADPFQINLQIKVQRGDRNVVVTGQLLRLQHPEIVGRDVPIMVSNLRGRVVQAITNQFGEFHAEIENSGDLELVFHGEQDKPVVISLRDALGQLYDGEPSKPMRSGSL
jgi:hypothetical protein